MKIKFADGSIVQFKNAKDAHDDLLLNKYDCGCHCEACSEDDPRECLESTLDQCYPGYEILEEDNSAKEAEEAVAFAEHLNDMKEDR